MINFLSTKLFKNNPNLQLLYLFNKFTRLSKDEKIQGAYEFVIHFSNLFKHSEDCEQEAIEFFLEGMDRDLCSYKEFTESYLSTKNEKRDFTQTPRFLDFYFMI